MFYVTVGMDDGVSAAGSSCSKCCCEPIGLKAGETSLFTINYAPWSVPIGGRGLVPPIPAISVVPDDSACSSQTIDGFSDPNATAFLPLVVAPNTPLVTDMLPYVTPVGNTFTFAQLPGGEPEHGSVSILGSNVTYTPPQGFNGWDHVWIRITDAQGRSINRELVFNVNATTPRPYEWGRTGLIINPTQVEINSRMHQVNFPILLNFNAACDTVEGCRKYRVTVKARASDCDRIFTRLDCFDVFCKRC